MASSCVLWRAGRLIRSFRVNFECLRGPNSLGLKALWNQTRQLTPSRPTLSRLLSNQIHLDVWNETKTHLDVGESWNGGTEAGMEQGQDEEEQNETAEVPVSDQKSLRVAIIGAPNAGKSTLINQLLQQKVFAVSPKVHTTTRRAMGVFTEANTQIVLMDTPGVIPNSYARHLKKSREFVADPLRSLMEADLVLVLVDAVNKFTRERIDVSILRLLRQYPHIKSILVLNKTDIVKEKSVLLKLVEVLTGSDDSYRHEIGYLVRKWKDRRLPPQTRREARKKIDQLETELAEKREKKRRVLESLKAKAAQQRLGAIDCMNQPPPSLEEGVQPSHQIHSNNENTSIMQATPTTLEPHPQEAIHDHWPYFDDVFMVSGLSGDGIDKLKQYFLDSAQKRAWEYSDSTVTDLPALTLVQDIIHEKICLYFDKEMPYVVRQENAIWERDDLGTLSIYQYLYCGKRTRLRMLIGHKGSTIQKITSEAEQDIQSLLNCPVELTIDVKI